MVSLLCTTFCTFEITQTWLFYGFKKQLTRACFKQTAKWQCDSVIEEHWCKKHRAELSLAYSSLLWLKTSGPDVWCWYLHEASVPYILQFIAWINAPLPPCGKEKKKKLLSHSVRRLCSLIPRVTGTPWQPSWLPRRFSFIFFCDPIFPGLGGVKRWGTKAIFQRA